MSHKCLHRLCVEMEGNDDTSQLLVEEVGDPVAWDDGHQKFKISGILMSQASSACSRGSQDQNFGNWVAVPFEAGPTFHFGTVWKTETLMDEAMANKRRTASQTVFLAKNNSAKISTETSS